MLTITGKVLRILPVKDVEIEGAIGRVIDLIVADEFDYKRVSLWDAHAELVRYGEIKTGDVVRIENAYVSEPKEGRDKRVNAGKYSRVTKVAADIVPLSHANAVKLTALAVARPEQGTVCVAGIDDHGEWIRPQGVFEADMDTEEKRRFKPLCVSNLYLDAWRGRRPRKEDRFFVYSTGIEKELGEREQKALLERHVDPSVDAVFKGGRSLGLIKPRILQVYEEKAHKKKEGKGYEQYIRFNFKDASGRTYRRWSCRCDTFYNAWNAMKTKHRWTYSWRMLRYLRKNETYLAIGLTHTDYGITGLEYGAFPLIVGVHVIQK